MPSQAAEPGQDTGGRGRSGHVSGKILSVTQALRGPPEGGRRGSERNVDFLPGLQPGGSAVPLGTGDSRRGAAPAGDPPTSEDSFESAPPRRRPQPINAELVKLVASFAPLELAQLKAMEQKARLKKAQAAAERTLGTVEQLVQAENAEDGAPLYEPEPVGGQGHEPPAHDDPARLAVRPAAPFTAEAPKRAAAASSSRPRSRSPSRPSYLPAAPAKGAVVKRDLNILPNPVAQKQTDALQRQAAVSAFVHRLQREQDVLRAEKERRMKAEHDALAAQLEAEKEARKAAALEVAEVTDVKPVPVKRKKPLASGGAPGLQGMQAAPAAQDAPEKKPVDPKPWRHNMRKHRGSGEPLAAEAPAGAHRDVAARAATDAPPPRNLSPGAAAARVRTLDPVARAALKDYMDRKAKDMAAKQQQEKAAQMEAKTAQLKVLKAEMAKARERAHKYAEGSKDSGKGHQAPRPAWVDVVPPEGSSVTQLRAYSPQLPSRWQPDADMVSERALPYHMSDAMRIEVTERRRQERLSGLASPTSTRSGRAVLVDSFGQPLDDDDLDNGPQVVRVHDPEVPAQAGRVYRAASARPTRPLLVDRTVSTQAALRQIQAGQPVAPETLRAMELEARLAARKQYEQQLRELQAAERRELPRSRDVSRGRDTSRGRRTSPTAGRKHHSASINSQSRSPPKRAKQQSRRARSASRTGSANRRMLFAESQPTSLMASLPARQHPAAIEAEMQQARNERHVGDLWDLALQLSARLGALQQRRQQHLQEPQQGGVEPVFQAWPEPQAQDFQAPLLDASMLPYPPPVANVRTALPADLAPLTMDAEAQGFPSKVSVHQFDEGQQAEVEFRTDSSWPDMANKTQQAEIEFRTESSWPNVSNKKMRTTADSTSTYGVGTSTSLGGFPGEGASSLGITEGVVPPSQLGVESVDVATSQRDIYQGSFDSDRDIDGMGDSASVLSSGLQPQSAAELTGTSLPGDEYDGAVTEGLGTPEPISEGDEEGLEDATASSEADEDYEDEPDSTRQPAAEPPLPPPQPAAEPTFPPAPKSISISVRSQSTAPVSPSKAVPAAPVIQIPVPSSDGKATSPSVEPSVGLPYDNAAFSAESADDDGGSSGEELTYGQRVLSIAELHNMLEDNPRLSQRLSLDRERDRWEEEERERESSRRGRLSPRARLSLAQQQHGRLAAVPVDEADGSSVLSSSVGTPTRACEAVVDEYELANSPLRLRPAQRELLKAQAAKRAEEQLLSSPTSELIPEQDTDDDSGSIQLPKADDPMSIINLIAHKGRLRARPTIIQLSAPPLQEVADQEVQRAGAAPAALDGKPDGAHQPISEILVFPRSSGPELVFSRELLHLSSRPTSPRKAFKDTGVGEGHVDPAAPSESLAQQLASSLPPYVITAAAPKSPLGSPPVSQGGYPPVPTLSTSVGGAPDTAVHPAFQSSLQQSVEAALKELRQSSPQLPTLSEQLARLEERRFAGGVAVAPHVFDSTGGASSTGLGAMASPQPRQRTVTFMDEALGPPEQVRLAPTELFKQMQDTLKTYEELDAAEVELQQLQNARAIAAVQREAHRIAQKLDQTNAAEAQLLIIAQTQADMDAKFHALEESIRNEVRKEGLGQLHDIASMFVQQLSRNKVAHATVQTTPQSPTLHRPEVGVQVDPPFGQHPISSLRSNSPPQQQVSPRHRGSPPSQPQTSLRAGSPPNQAPTSLRATSPPPLPKSALKQVPTQTSQSSLGGFSPPPQAQQPSHGGSHGPAPSIRFERRSSATSAPTTEYSENFEDGESSFISGRPQSRAAHRQVSHMSVPEESEIEESDGLGRSDYVSQEFRAQASMAGSIPEKISSYRRDRQPSRASIRQPSTSSIPEIVLPERGAARLTNMHQHSTLSVAEDITEDLGDSHGRSGLHQASGISMAESIAFERTAESLGRTTRPGSEGGSRWRSSVAVTESIPHSSAGGNDMYGTGSIQESIPGHQSSNRLIGKRPSDRSQRRRSTVGTEPMSETAYSSTFDDDVTEDVMDSSHDVRTATGDYSTDVVESEPSGKRVRQQQSHHTATTVSTQSVGDSEARIEQPDSYSQDIADETGLGSSSRSASRLSRPQEESRVASGLGITRSTNGGAGLLGAMLSPVPTRTAGQQGDALQAKPSPLNLRASLEGGLELDDAMMASYAADAEARMRQELGLLTDRLLDVNTRASAKMVQLEAELANESLPQKRQAIIRAQRLVQVQQDADAADIQRQISAVKADYARQQLMLERLYRLAEITSPAPVAFKGRGMGQAFAQVASDRATVPAAPPPTRVQPLQTSKSSSIAEEEKSFPQQTSTSGSVPEEQPARQQPPRPQARLAREQPKQRQASASGSVAEESMQEPEVTSEASVAYSGGFDPPTAMHSVATLRPQASRPSQGRARPASSSDEIAESLSGARESGTRVQSQSVVNEADFPRTSSAEGVSTGTSSKRQSQPSSGSVAATESQYSDERDTCSASIPKPTQRPSRPRAAASQPPDNDDTSSELSAQSSVVERKRRELEHQLREEEKEQRRARIRAKEAEIARMQEQLRALRNQKPTAASVKPRSTPAPKSKRLASSDVEEEDTAVSHDSIRSSSGLKRAGASSDIPESNVGDSVVEESEAINNDSIKEEGGSVSEEETTGAGHTSSSRDRDDTYASDAYDTLKSSSGAKESGTSSGNPQDQVLDSLKNEIARLEEEKLRLRNAELQALQEYKRKLAEEVKSLKLRPPAPKPPKPAAAPAPAPAPSRKPDLATQSLEASGDSAPYSADLHQSGSVPYSADFNQSGSAPYSADLHQTGSISEATAKASSSASRSRSTVGEQTGLSAVGSHVRLVPGSGSRSSSVIEYDAVRPAGASRSSGGGASSSQRSRGGAPGGMSADMYEESFETESMHGGSVARDASEIMDEAQDSGDMSHDAAAATTLEPINEEEVPGASIRSLTFAGPSVVDDDVQDTSFPQAFATDDVAMETGFTRGSFVDDEVAEFEAERSQRSSSDDVGEMEFVDPSAVREDDDEVEEVGEVDFTRGSATLETGSAIPRDDVAESGGIEEEGQVYAVATSATMEDEIEDIGPVLEASNVTVGSSAASSRIKDVVAAQTRSRSVTRDSVSQPGIDPEFLTTADINTPSVAPSVISGGDVAEEKSQASTAPQSIDIEDEDTHLNTFLTSANTIGESAAPSIRSDDLSVVQESGEVREPLQASRSTAQSIPVVGGSRQLSFSPQSASQDVEDDVYIIQQESSSGSVSGEVAEERVSGSRFGQSGRSSAIGASLEDEVEDRAAQSGSTRQEGTIAEDTTVGYGDSQDAYEATNLEVDEPSERDSGDSVQEEEEEEDDDEGSEPAEIFLDVEDLGEGTYSDDLEVGEDGEQETMEIEYTYPTAGVSRDAGLVTELSVAEEPEEAPEPSSIAEVSQEALEPVSLAEDSADFPRPASVVELGRVPERSFIGGSSGGAQEPTSIGEESAGAREPTSVDVPEDSRLPRSGTSTPSSPLSSSSSSSSSSAEEAEEYELDFQQSAITMQAEESIQRSVGRASAPRSESRSTSSGELVQDASEILAQPSILEVASTASLGTSRGVAAGGRGAPPLLHQQASSVSAATYEDDFETGEASESQLAGLAPGDRTTLSIVIEEGEGLQPRDTTGSRMYSDEFASESAAQITATASTLLPAAGAATSELHAVADVTDEESEPEDIIEDVSYNEDEPEPDEDEQQYSGAPLGMVLPTPVAASMGIEASQRYGPASDDSSREYSEDLQEPETAEVDATLSVADVAEDELASASLSTMAPVARQNREPPSASGQGGATQSAQLVSEGQSGMPTHGDTLDRDQAPAKKVSSSSSSSSSSGRSGKSKTKSESVFSVEEEASGSATVSSERSADAPFGKAAVPDAQKSEQEASTLSPQPSHVQTAGSAQLAGAEEDDEKQEEGLDDYTRDFPGLPSEMQGSPVAAQHSHKEVDIVSHPISQPPSPPGQSDGDTEAEPKEDLEVDEEEFEGDLDMSDLGLDVPPAATVPLSERAGAAAQREAAAAAERSGVDVGAELKGEESEVIPVSGGRSLHMTRQIESRTWRSQQPAFDDEQEEEGPQVDLMDVSMAGEEESGILERMGVDIIEASEALTPSHSMRMRNPDLASGPSFGSPFGLRSALSVRLATLQEQFDGEGEGTEASSEVVTPSARGSRAFDSDFMRASQAAGDQESREPEQEEEEPVEEEVVASEHSAASEGAAPFKATVVSTKRPAELAKESSATALPAREASSASAKQEAASTAADEPKPQEASREASAEYDDGFEAPASEDSGVKQSVVEYDLYTSAALAATDSDELAEMAAAFESQAIGGDDDDEQVPAEYSGISASGLSDDLAKYKVTVEPESDEETQAPAAAPSAREVVAASSPQLPEPTEAASPSEPSEASEVLDEEPEAAGNDPFSVDESIDRMPVLQPSAQSTSASPPAQSATTPSALHEEPVPAPMTSSPPVAEPENERERMKAAEPKQKASSSSSSSSSSSPSSRSAKAGLVEESSLGPLPRSGLGGDDDDDDGQGLEYRALYKPADAEPSEVALGSFSLAPPVAPSAPAATAEDKPQSDILEQLKALAGSDDDAEEPRLGSRPPRTSTSSIQPVLQAILDEPDSMTGSPKGDFESEIEAMLTASRDMSRLVSPYQSRDLTADGTDGEAMTPLAASTRASMSGLAAAPSLLVGTVPEPSEPAAALEEEKSPPPEPPSRDAIVDEITEATVKELVSDAVDAIDGAMAAPSAATQAPAAPSEDRDRLSVGGEASISMSVDDLEGDIELEGDLAMEEETGLDLPSPLASDSGSLGSPRRPAYEPPGASKLSAASSGAPALAPERSGRDLALSSSADDAPVDSGVGLNSDEDLGWGGADEDPELDDSWQPDVSGLIAPEIDQAAIERENAPAVAAGQEAVAQYAEQVLEQFMANRPEFLLPVAEPLSLEGFLDQERRLVHASEAQHIHNKMVYDAINEALLAIYRSANRIHSQPWLRRNRVVKPLPGPKEMAAQVQEQLKKWAAMRMRDPAEIDKVLAADAVEDGRARADLAFEEAEVQREVAELIWVDLIDDTAEVLSDLEQLLTPAVSAARVGGPSLVPVRRRL